MEVPQKTKSRVTMRSSHPTPTRISGQNYDSERCLHPYIHGSTGQNGQADHLGAHRQMNGYRCGAYTRRNTAQASKRRKPRHLQQHGCNPRLAHQVRKRRTNTVRERFMRNRKYDTKERVCETETDAQTCGTYVAAGEGLGEGLQTCRTYVAAAGRLGQGLQTCRTYVAAAWRLGQGCRGRSGLAGASPHRQSGGQQGPAVQRGELCSVACAKPSWKRIQKRKYLYVQLSHFAAQK